jgi:nucleoside-diphosphate-sugar epimerase
MNRTVAVTGGSGKLGRAVVAALIEEGWTVVNFDRVPRPSTPTSRPSRTTRPPATIDKARRLLGSEPPHSWRDLAST